MTASQGTARGSVDVPPFLGPLGSRSPEPVRHVNRFKIRQGPSCGSVRRNLAQCDRPGRLKNTKHSKGKSTPVGPTSKPPAGGRPADAQVQRSPDKPKDKKKGKGKGTSEKNKAKTKIGEVDFADEDQEEVDDNVGVNEKDAEACEAVAVFSDSEDIFGYVADWDESDASDYKGCIRAPVACETASLPQKIVNDKWELRGPCCLVRFHRQPRKKLFTLTWQEPVWKTGTV